LGVSGGRNAFPGTPTTTLGSPPGTDSYTARDQFFVFLSGTAAFPVAPGVSLIGHAGYGWANKTVTYNCVGFCTLAGIPQSSTEKDVTLGGPAFGGGIRIDPWSAGAMPPLGGPSPSVVFEFDYTRFIPGDRSVNFGTPAGVNVNFKVGQEVDIFTGRVVFPLGVLPLPR
jgi:hypothetical protein